MRFLTDGAQGNHGIFPGVDGDVIGPVTPYVGSAVDQPGGVKRQAVSQESGHEVAHCQRLPPEVPGHQRGHQEAKDDHGELVVPGSRDQLTP